MRGTPTLILIDRAGQLRLHEFGRMDDLRLGMVLGQLLAEYNNPNDFIDPAAIAAGEPFP